jgi:hypothetical protein
LRPGLSQSPRDAIDPKWYDIIRHRTMTHASVAELVEDKIKFYHDQAERNRNAFRRWKVFQMVLAGLIPVCSMVGTALNLHNTRPGLITSIDGIFGFLIAVAESIQQLFQFQQLWYSYRVSWRSLEGEEFLFSAASGPYASMDEQQRLSALAERSQSIISAGQSERSRVIRKLEGDEHLVQSHSRSS